MVAISDEIDIDRAQVLHNIGYGADYKPSARIMSLINEYIENAHNLIAPSYSYVIRDIKSVKGPRVVVEDSVTFQSEVIAQLLEQCEKVAVFALTIGNHLEELVAHLAESGVIVQAAVLDAIGSGATEKVADFVQGRIVEAAQAQGLCASQRFCPGYCDWNVSEQKRVFQTMNGNSAGIRLTEGCLMLPRKSMSGIIGIGPCNGNIENYNPCKSCNKDNCLDRR